MKKSIVSLIIIVCFSLTTSAQKTPNPVLTADSLATGNYKDIFTSFFQLSFDKLTGKDKQITFATSPFAVMARADTNLLVDTSYLKYKNLRKLNFSFCLKLDSSYKFNGFSSGIKYTLINKRDETISNSFIELILNDSSVKELYYLNSAVTLAISKIADINIQIKNMAAYTDFLDGKTNYGKLDKSLKDIIAKVASDSTAKYLPALLKNPDFNIKNTESKIYERLKKLYNNRPLWTIGITDTTYKNEFAFSSILINSEFLKGIGDTSKRNNVEFNIKAGLLLTDDTLQFRRDLKRSIFSFEPGLNFILNSKDEKRSWLEFKLSGSYSHNFNGLYKNEKRDNINLNGTLRIRVISDIWIPVEIKYDPRTGNVFGFLNIRANFKALGSVAKFLK